MYTIVLDLHSWVRWVALAAGFGATISALLDTGDGRRLERWGMALTTAVDLQMLLGLLLYFALSPFTREAMRDFPAAMKSPGLRFFAVEHVTMMIAAVVLVHVGRVLARKAATPAARRTRSFVCFGVATVLMIVGTPWPGMVSGRPLFRI
jgi:heme A synthase